MFFAAAALAALVAAPLQQAQAAEDSAIVETHLGKARGVLRNGVLEWRGLPFAQPPVGELRWKAPLPARGWDGVRDASQFGAACPQVARYGITEASETEDCLTLNVTTPLDSRGQPRKKRPVLVWIHGGVFVGGSSSLYRLDMLARRGDIVVVSINYRIGALGFLANPGFDPEANGAFGLADQRLALRWVQTNIEAFGGDPARVTVAGESAGAGSVCQHLLAPERTRGLFHQAIVQSAGCMGPLKTVTEAAETSRQMAADPKLACDTPTQPLECLRKAPAAALLAAQGNVAASDPMAFFPSVGSPNLPRPANESVAQGKILRMPLINGGTRDELRLFLAYDAIAGKTVTDANLPDWIATLYGKDNVATVLKAYPAQAEEKPAERYGAMISDYNPYIALNNCLYLHSANVFARFMPVWEFEFADRNAPVIGVGVPKNAKIDFQLGAVHSSELNYFFPNLSNTFKIDAPDLAPPSQALADKMVDYWASFVKTGVPKAKGAPAWPRYTTNGKVLWLEPNNIHVVKNWTQHKCDVWRSLYPQRLGGRG